MSWDLLKRHLDEGATPWPEWLPPLGPGAVTPVGYEAVRAEHLGPQPCMALRAGDIVGIAWDADSGDIQYVHVPHIHSRPEGRLLELDLGEPGQLSSELVPMMRLFGSVWRPVGSLRRYCGPVRSGPSSG